MDAGLLPPLAPGDLPALKAAHATAGEIEISRAGERRVVVGLWHWIGCTIWALRAVGPTDADTKDQAARFSAKAAARLMPIEGRAETPEAAFNAARDALAKIKGEK